MSPRERRLRERIDRLTDERDAARREAKGHSMKGKRILTCVYCGQRTRTVRVPATCPLHHSLVALDPFYSEAVAA